MTLPESEVEKIAHLARLALDPGRVGEYAGDLERILELFEALSEVDTDALEPMAHPLDLAQRLRPDEVTEADASAELLALAPEVSGGLFVVPKVIE